MKLPYEISARGWMLLSEDEANGLKRIVLRNVRLTQSTAQNAVDLLEQIMSRSGWRIIHHGQTNSMWSALLEREVL